MNTTSQKQDNSVGHPPSHSHKFVNMGDAGIEIPLPEPQLPISQPSVDRSQPQPRQIHVLVTGFGPFKSFTNNPSYLIASALPKTLSPAPPPPPPSKESSKPPTVRGYLPSFLNRHLSAHTQPQDNAQTIPQPVRNPNEKPYIIHVHTYPDPIHVAYASTSVLVPSLLDPATNGSVFPESPGGIDFDYVFHIGLASGRDSYTLETLAHRDDYLIPDVDDSIGTAISEIWKREDVPGSLEVGWDGADVLRRWKAEVERREAEDSVDNVSGLAAFPTPAQKPDGNPSSASDRNDQQDTNDASAKAWILQHGVLLHSPSKATPQSNEDAKPKPNTNLPSYTPIGGGSGLRQNINAASNTTTTTTTGTSTSTPSRPPRKSIVKLSRDAGRFLCEFILMCSLTHRYKQHQYVPIASDSDSKLGKVAFLHVPNGTEPADVARGAMIAESAIRSVVGSWEAGWRNVAVFEDEEGEAATTGGAAAGAGAGVGEGGFEDKGTGDEIPR